MEKDGVFKFSEPFRIDPDKLTDEHRTWLPKFQGSEQGKAIPVSNTITSTTSATQDLEIFKNYPSDKNNKLLKKKYGNKEANFLDYEKNLFQKVTEEEQQAGDPYAKTLSFEEVLGSSFDSNLPVTKISEETAKRFDPYGLKAQADYSDPNAHIMSQADSSAIMNQAGAGTPRDYQYYGQTGGLKPKGVDDYRYYGQTGGLKPESGIDTIKPSRQEMEDHYSYGLGGEMFHESKRILENLSEEKRKKVEEQASILQEKYNINNSPTKEEEQGFSKEFWPIIQQAIFDPGTKETLSKYPATLGGKIEGGIDTIKPKDYHYYGQTGGLKPTESKSIVPPEITEGISAIESPDDVSVSSEGRLEELKKKILNKEEHRLPVSGDMPKWVQAMRLTLPLDELDEFMELIGAGVSGEDAHEIRKKKEILGKEFGLSTGDLLMWNAKQTGKSFKEVKEQIDDGKKRAKVMGLGVDQLVGPSNTEWDEIKKREEILKNEGQSGLDEYMLDLAKKEDAAKNKEKKSVSDTLIDSDYKMTEKDGILQIPKVDVEQHEIKDLSKRSEAIDQYYLQKKLARKLNEEEKEDVTTNLESQGVETKGLTDKNMLLISMGLGMMASQKPGLTGAGEGALTGLKIVAPLMKEKSSDIQMITVKDKDGKNIVVRYNKKKGTYEKTGLTSPTTGTQTKADQLREIGAMANIPPDVMATAYYKSLTESKGKSYEDRVDSMIKNLNMSLKGFNIPLEDLRAAAEKAIGGGNSGLSLKDLGLE